MKYNNKIVFLSFFFPVDTELPITIKQSPSPPPHHHHSNNNNNNNNHHHQQRLTNLQIKTEPSATNNGQQISHRPLLHNLLSGAPIHTTPYHRTYCTSSTGQYFYFVCIAFYFFFNFYKPVAIE